MPTKLFYNKAVAFFGKASEGFYYELSFDVADGIYKLESDKSFKTPIEAHDHCILFCTVNEIEFSESWELL